MKPLKTIAILGTAGVPGSYGGFETLAENLVRYHQTHGLPGHLVVYCSSKRNSARPDTFHGAELRYIALNANGPASVLYDIVSLMSAVRRGCDTILLFGVSGAVALPLVRQLSLARVITHVDGVEWKRGKWSRLARWWLRQSERWAVRFSNEVIADNAGIAEYLLDTYGQRWRVIAYGGDHAVQTLPQPYPGKPLPLGYALSLCRIEPENHVDLILNAFSGTPEVPLVFVGNWGNSAFGQALRRQYQGIPHLRLLDPIYDLGVLRTIRENASIYIHGHSAGGTNPSLVEIMHFGLPVLAYDCVFNRYTTDGRALYFKSADDLCARLAGLTAAMRTAVGTEMFRLAQERYTWASVGREYFHLIDGDA
jgi:glycosyltransferase involved in cell wall biosynthesis